MVSNISNLKFVVELFTYLYCLAELFGKKLKISIYMVILTILDLFLLVGINRYGFPAYLRPLLYMGLFIYGLLCYGESVKTTLVNCILAAIIVTVLQLLVYLPLYYLFFLKYQQIEANELLIMIGCFLVIVLGSHKIRLKSLSDFCTKRNKLLMGVFIFILCGFGMNFYQIRAEAKIMKEIYIQMVYFILIFLFIIYEWQKSKMDAEKRKAQLELNRLYYDAYDQLLVLIRERQHDMKNHINAILSMIYTTNNYDELVEKQKEYCGYVIGQNEKTRLVLSTGNPLIAGFLYSKIQEAENKKIEVNYQIKMPKVVSVVPEYELVEMMGILIDNAIEASSNVNENEVEDTLLKKIYLSMIETEENIELIVSNISDHYEQDVTERFFEAGYSSKGKGRGIGLPKLKRLVHDRKGEIEVSNELNGGRNYLTFTIRIPKEKRQKF